MRCTVHCHMSVTSQSSPCCLTGESLRKSVCIVSSWPRFLFVFTMCAQLSTLHNAATDIQRRHEMIQILGRTLRTRALKLSLGKYHNRQTILWSYRWPISRPTSYRYTCYIPKTINVCVLVKEGHLSRVLRSAHFGVELQTIDRRRSRLQVYVDCVIS